MRKIQMVFFLLGFGLTGFAQRQTTENEQDLNREMTLEREYDPIVQDAAKVTTLPPIREVNITKRPITYSDYAVPMMPEKAMNTLPPGRMMTDVDHTQRDGYLHLGGGMLLNLMGDFGYKLLNTDRDRLSISFSHRSTNGDVKFENDIVEPRKAKINDNLGGLDFKHHFYKATLSLGGNFGYSAFNYYGLPTHPGLYAYYWYYPNNDVTTNQGNRLIQAYGGISSDDPESLGYHLGVDYNNFKQKYSLMKDFDGMTENHFSVNAGLRSRVNDGRSFGLDLKGNVLTYKAPVIPPSVRYDPLSPSIALPVNAVDSAFDTHYNATLTPYFSYESGTWRLFLGVNLMLVSQNGEKIPFASPNIKLDVPFANWNVFYADLGGGVETNSMAELSRTNRYVNPAFTADATKTWADLKIGVRSSAATGLWFDIYGGYRYAESEVFYNPSFYYWIEDGFNNVSMAFQPVSQRLQAGAILKYDHMHIVDFYLKGEYNHYQLKYAKTWKNDYADFGLDENSELKPYGKPEIVAGAGINVRPVKPLTLSLDYCMMSGIYANPGFFPDNDIKMKTIHDLRFRTSWKFNELFSIYAQCNNLLFQRHALYYGYPLQPFSAMAGLCISF